MSFAQTSLAITIFGSTIATYYACSPPNPSPEPNPKDGTSSSDLVRRVGLTGRHSTKIALSPVAFLSLHASALAYSLGNSSSSSSHASALTSIPSSILRHGAKNGLQINLITWSPQTVIPLALILCAGVPLRFVSYASLGKSFTFALAAPDRLNTSGIYRYVQHPSYTGLAVLVLSNLALLCRFDGALSCWFPPRWYPLASALEWPAAAVYVGLFLYGMGTRVKQEEGMLKAKFGREWEEWHHKTARFIPWLF